MASKGRAIKHKVLVTDNDRGFLAQDTPLFTFTKTSTLRGKKVYNVAPKGLVLWTDTDDGSVPTAIEPANLVVGDLSKLHLGVGVDSDGDGITDYIREAGLGQLDGCNITNMTASGAQCGVPEIKAVYPGCLGCEPLSLRIRVDDNQTRSFGPWNRSFAEFTSTYSPDCATCDGCDTTVTCDEYMCGLVDQINEDLNLNIQGEPYPNYGGIIRPKPFKAVKLHDNWDAFCISGEDTACEDCVEIAALTTFTVDSVAYNFSDAVKNPADNTKTLMTQLNQAAFEIEAKIQEVHGKHGGFAIVTKGEGNCCPAQLHVVSCDATFAVAGLTPCAEAITQFPSFSEEGVCQECGTAPTVTTPSCGIAIIAEQDTIDCDCFYDQVPAFLGRHVTIDVISDGPVSKSTKKATLQEGAVPGNFGAEIQYLEYGQRPDPGVSYGNNPQGWLGQPGKDARIRNIQSDCNKSYCVYGLEHRNYEEFGRYEVSPMNELLMTYIAVPEKDTTTQTAVDALRSQLIALSPNACAAITTVQCDGTAL